MQQQFKEELRDLPEAITLVGNPMLVEIAKSLLAIYAPHISTDQGTKVQLMSRETFCCHILACMLEEQNPPTPPLLLYTISEEELKTYARNKNIPLIEEEHDDVRAFLDELAKEQPQTYSSLTRSGQRLLKQLQVLRT